MQTTGFISSFLLALVMARGSTFPQYEGCRSASQNQKRKPIKMKTKRDLQGTNFSSPVKSVPEQTMPNETASDYRKISNGNPWNKENE